MENYLRKLLLAIPLAVVGFAFGMLASIPVNFIIDTEAAQVLWFGGGISGFDRFSDHRMRTFLTGLFFAYIFYHIGISQMKSRLQQSKQSPDTGNDE